MREGVILDTVPFIKKGGAMDMLQDFDQRGILYPPLHMPDCCRDVSR